MYEKGEGEAPGGSRATTAEHNKIEAGESSEKGLSLSVRVNLLLNMMEKSIGTMNTLSLRKTHVATRKEIKGQVHRPAHLKRKKRWEELKPPLKGSLHGKNNADRKGK